MGVEWHPVENSKLASAGVWSDYHFVFDNETYAWSQAGMVSSNFGIEGKSVMHSSAYLSKFLGYTQ